TDVELAAQTVELAFRSVGPDSEADRAQSTRLFAQHGRDLGNRGDGRRHGVVATTGPWARLRRPRRGAPAAAGPGQVPGDLRLPDSGHVDRPHRGSGQSGVRRAADACPGGAI